ncbi:MAG TPA: DUF6088 family protein [Candidatus Obscuribacterales bacterium]
MNTQAFVLRHIFVSPPGKILTTREFLIYGSRAAVDQALSRLVKKGILRRLARGVFLRHDSELANITVWDVARVKAQSFGKQIAGWGGNIAAELGLLEPEKLEPIFAVNGSSSGFYFGHIFIQFRRTCPRRMRFADTRAGKAIRALWHLGRGRCRQEHVHKATQSCLRSDREEIRLSFPWIPAWLSSYFLDLPLPLGYVKNHLSPASTAAAPDSGTGGP